MARAGLYKSDVEKARNSLIAQGRHPSVDAVRVALGNTGSKTTIHKYLKELEEEYGGQVDRNTFISDALHDLITQLATQLEAEANQRMMDLESQFNEKDRIQKEAVAMLTGKLTTLQHELALAVTTTEKEIQSHERTKEALQNESIAKHTLIQQVMDLKDRLAENEAHRQSLEEKHGHARDALEHYRAAVKTQRDQDIQRHEHQVQQLQAELRQLQQTLVLKQHDITQLNKDGAKLVAELAHAKKLLYDEKNSTIRLQAELESQRTLVEKVPTLKSQVTEGVAQLSKALAQNDALTNQLNNLNLELIASQSKVEVQQHMMAEFKAWIAGQLPGVR